MKEGRGSGMKEEQERIGKYGQEVSRKEVKIGEGKEEIRGMRFYVISYGIGYITRLEECLIPERR